MSLPTYCDSLICELQFIKDLLNDATERKGVLIADNDIHFLLYLYSVAKEIEELKDEFGDEVTDDIKLSVLQHTRITGMSCNGDVVTAIRRFLNVARELNISLDEAYDVYHMIG